MAAFVGVAATGAVIARAERHAAPTPRTGQGPVARTRRRGRGGAGPAASAPALPAPDDPGMPAWRQMLLGAVSRHPRVDRGPGHEPRDGDPERA
ncbi:hypothetical protein HFP72_00510 [Nocardiopsis sp. ARC36]